ncbi:MAG TPA: gamma-glutamyltransferase [Geminicoccaceae bacterium]
MPERPPVRATRHAIAAGHYLAAEAGFEILNAGGNAVDAAAAAGLALGVVQPDIVNVAGVAPIMIWHAERGELITLDGLGVWPQATDVRVFEREHGGHVPEGVLRTVVPAAPDAWLTALEHYGTMSFGDVAAAALDLARDGFVVHELLAETIRTHQADYARFPENARIFLPGGAPPAVGAVFRQPDLAGVLQHLIDEERATGGSRAAGLGAVRRAFYQGDLAQTLAAFHAAEGGWLDRGDLASFRVREESPVRRPFGPLDVATCGPWCQGPVLLEVLGLLRAEELRAAGRNTPAYLHRLAQALDLAFSDREAWFGDPRFTDVPLEGLLDPDYLAGRRGMMSEQAFDGMPPAGDPPGGRRAGTERTTHTGENRTLDTSYVAVVDRFGNAVSATPSDVSYSSPVVPGTGLVPSSRGSQSWGFAGHPCAAAPGRRPRLTPNPAMAFRNGRPYLVFGTPGGDVQTQAMLQFLLGAEVFGLGLQAAVDAPRMATFNFPSSFEPHGMLPSRLMLEPALAEVAGDDLARRGYDIRPWPERAWQAGAICALRIDPETGVIEAAADLRRPAAALGW